MLIQKISVGRNRSLVTYRNTTPLSKYFELYSTITPAPAYCIFFCFCPFITVSTFEIMLHSRIQRFSLFMTKLSLPYRKWMQNGVLGHILGPNKTTTKRGKGFFFMRGTLYTIRRTAQIRNEYMFKLRPQVTQ
jgi:hypothetical protein